MTLRSATKYCVVLASVLTFVGCESSRDAAPGIDRKSGPLADERYQWTAAAGIDLLTGPAVPIRAFVESRLDAQAMASLDYAYPGFDEAVANPAPGEEHDMLTNNLRPDEDRSAGASASDSVRIGNDRLRIQSLTHDGNDVTAIVCHYRYGLAIEQQNGEFVSVVHDSVNDDGIEAMMVKLRAPAQGSEPLPPQSGPAPAPTADVFGGWKIVGFLNGIRSPEPDFDKVWLTFDADTATCVEHAPEPPARRAFLSEGEHPRSDFPTSPPVPGWPEAVSE
ncbi:MAG TPA: hypothetical protein VHH12_07055 [Mycobacterium sp.]|nr:hypothetical protein [Mycobacterium sp.]